MTIRDLLKPTGNFRQMPVLSQNQWFFIFAGLYLGLVAIGLWVMRLPGEHILIKNSRLTGMMLFPLVLTIVSLTVLKKLGVDFIAELKDWKSNFKMDALLGLSYFGAYALLVGLLLASGLGSLMENSRDAALTSVLLGNPAALWVVVFSLVVLAPLGEEIAFKRLLYVGMRREYSVLRAILTCSLLFVLFHPRSAYLSMLVFVPVTYYMYERHRRLQANIILHALINLAGIVSMLF